MLCRRCCSFSASHLLSCYAFLCRVAVGSGCQVSAAATVLTPQTVFCLCLCLVENKPCPIHLKIVSKVFLSCLLLFPAFGTFRHLLFHYVFLVKFHPFKPSFPPSHPHPGVEPALAGSGAQQQFLGGLGPTRCPRATAHSLTPVSDLQTLQRREARVPPPVDQDFSRPTVLPALKMEQEEYSLPRSRDPGRWPHVQALYVNQENQEACGAGVTAWGQKAERWAGMRRGTGPTRREGHGPQSVTHFPHAVLSVWGAGPRPPVQGWWAAPLQRGATDGPLVHSSRTVFQDSSQKLTITLHFLHGNCLHRKEFHSEDAFTEFSLYVGLVKLA